MANDKTDNPTYPNHEWVPPSLTTARRKFASTRRLPHKKMQRRILIAVPIRREYMEDAPEDQAASVNAFDGRGEEDDGTNMTDGHSSLGATLRQPTSNGGDKNTKVLMAQQRGETYFNRGQNSNNREISAGNQHRRIYSGEQRVPAFRSKRGTSKGYEADKGWQSAVSA